MAGHDFASLFAKYPTVIAAMPDSFTSHEFILHLAHQYQTLYIEALYSYRGRNQRGSPAPFFMVHGILAQQLLEYPKLIRQVRKNVPSKTIFGGDAGCSEWKKVKKSLPI